MKLGLQLGYWGAQPNPFHVALAQEAERSGFDSVWTAEAWGSDAFTPAAWIGAHTSAIRLCTGIVQISARTPASCAMHALTIDHLTERPVRARTRRLRSAGRRGLVRRSRSASRSRARASTSRSCGASCGATSPSSSAASTTACRTTDRTRGASASRSVRSRTRCVPTCRSTSAPKARRTSRSRPRSPTVGCRSTTRRSARRSTPIRSVPPQPSPASRSPST